MKNRQYPKENFYNVNKKLKQNMTNTYIYCCICNEGVDMYNKLLTVQKKIKLGNLKNFWPLFRKIKLAVLHPGMTPHSEFFLLTETSKSSLKILLYSPWRNKKAKGTTPWVCDRLFYLLLILVSLSLALFIGNFLPFSLK